MCGRYTIKDPEALKRVLTRLGYAPRSGFTLAKSYNVAPTQQSPIATAAGAEATPWGYWTGVFNAAQGKVVPSLLVNARSETVAEKRAFKDSLQLRRCLVPTDGFFEWKREGGKAKQAYHFRLRGDAPFVVAGILQAAGGDKPAGYCLLTTGPNAVMAPIHDRLPAILTDEKARVWMDEKNLTQADVNALCTPYAGDDMEVYPVSDFVNNARHDDETCIARIDPAAGPSQLELL